MLLVLFKFLIIYTCYEIIGKRTEVFENLKKLCETKFRVCADIDLIIYKFLDILENWFNLRDECVNIMGFNYF